MLHLIDHEIVLLDASEIRWSRINTSVGCLHSPTQDCDGGELTSGTSQFHSTSELQQGDIEQDLSYFQLPNDLGTLHSPMVPITLPNTSKPTNATNIQAESVNASPALSSTYPSPTPSTSSASTRVAKRQTPNELRAEYLEIERKKLKMMELELTQRNDRETQPKSEDYHFLMSILPQMERLPPIQKLD
ncbi:hypothetical protein EVAR_20294_1 [Eumeta japonica]|uniref:BESS domain-containing protein n=1 Tax=Eumeta variegata TaxID=151549 RepID=A0A4C1VP23_EUMVA|nr:hypothetical protein EVAR_20294_1 [Eumeta japonica]